MASDSSDNEMEEDIDSELDDVEVIHVLWLSGKISLFFFQLQKAFQEGRLKPVLNIEQKPKRPLINNKVE